MKMPTRIEIILMDAKFHDLLLRTMLAAQRRDVVRDAVSIAEAKGAHSVADEIRALDALPFGN